jgi:hypothetical protein
MFSVRDPWSSDSDVDGLPRWLDKVLYVLVPWPAIGACLELFISQGQFVILYPLTGVKSTLGSESRSGHL